MRELAPFPVSQLHGRGLRIGIAVARYNWHITGTMLNLALTELERLEVATDHIDVVTVPGSYELPIVAKTLLAHASYDALICFGCVMKGATRHDVLVGDATAQSIQQLSLTTGVPIIFGVMCAETQQQAEERILRGTECAHAAVELARTIQILNHN